MTEWWITLPIGRRSGHWVGEDVLPLGEDQVGGDAQGPELVAFGDEGEEDLRLLGPWGRYPRSSRSRKSKLSSFRNRRGRAKSRLAASSSCTRR